MSVAPGLNSLSKAVKKAKEEDIDYCLFLLNNPNKVQDLPNDFGGAKCPKFNIVGPVEWNNLQLAQKIASAQNKELKYKKTKLLNYYVSLTQY